MNVLIPMAGAGTRIRSAGYSFPKPLVRIGDKPMVQIAVDALNLKCKHIFVVQKEQDYEFNYGSILCGLVDNLEIVRVSSVTEGAACSALAAKSLINNDESLLISVCDVYNDFGFDLNSFFSSGDDGIIFCFYSHDSKFSYVREHAGYARQVAEKELISEKATTGIYYWKRGSDFVRLAERMIGSNKRSGNEFCLAPVYNEAIAEGMRIATKTVRKFYDLGTQESITEYLEA